MSSVFTSPSGVSLSSLSWNGTLTYNGTVQIGSGTSDGSDNQRLRLHGGGAPGATRGAMINLAGNEHTNTGKMQLITGDVAGGDLECYTRGILRWTFADDGRLVQDATNGGPITFTKANTTLNFAGTMGTSSKNPAVDAANGFVELQVNGVTKYIPYYTA